jgi:hypothetical protein
MIDLSYIPLVDNHCHAILQDQRIEDLAQWRSFFTEGPGEETRRKHVATTLFYRRLIHHLADFFGCEPTEEVVLAARQALPPDRLIADLFRAANLETLVVDQGYPPRDIALPNAALAARTGCHIAPLLRLEVLMQELVAQYDTLTAAEEALRAALQGLRGQGYVGLKSIAAYRTGLNIKRWSRAEAQEAFDVARADAVAKGSVRLAHKPLLDTLLHIAFEQADRQELPVQFHTGYGDPDADLLLANPLHLRGVLEDPAYRAMSVVLLHESYPYTQQAGYLAAVYDNVYLDLSYAIPFLSYGAMVDFTRQALGVAPTSKLLYASDAVWLPELFWMSAVDGRRVLGQVLSEVVAAGELSAGGAETVGAAVLRDNALRLYGLGID